MYTIIRLSIYTSGITVVIRIYQYETLDIKRGSGVLNSKIYNFIIILTYN